MPQLFASSGTVVGVGTTNVPPDLTNVVAVAVGGSHSLALREDGTIVAWGQNASGQTNVPANLPPVKAIAAGQNHSVALGVDGIVYVWGDNTSGQTNIPVGLTNVTHIAATARSCIAVIGGFKTIRWGENPHPVRQAGINEISSVAAGTYHEACADSKGAVRSNYGLPPGLSNIVAVASRGERTLALQRDGRVLFWQHSHCCIPSLGDLGWTDIVAISMSDSLTMGLRSNGTVLTSGANVPGISTLRNVIAVAPGQSYHLVITSASPAVVTQPRDQTVSRGRHTFLTAMAVGSPPLTFQWQRDGVNVDGAVSNTLQTSVGGEFRCLVSSGGTTVTSATARATFVPVAIWGDGSFGQANLWPALSEAVSVAVGKQHSLAILSNGSVFAWGDDSFGQVPAPPGITNAMGIAGGGRHSLALLASGEVVAWGDNSVGQTAVPSIATNIVAVAAGEYHNLAVRADGTVVAWGTNRSSLLTVPLEATDVIRIAASGNYNLALRRDGIVVNWGGLLSIPRLGINNAIEIATGYPTPAGIVDDCSIALRHDGSVVVLDRDAFRFPPPAGLTNLAAVGAGYDTYFALKTDGTVAAWGGLGYMALTNGAVSLSNVISISAANAHAAALIGDGLPHVVRQPVPSTAALGADARFLATAVGQGELHFQWFLNDTPLANETNRLLQLRNVQRSNAGDYWVRVTNALGAIESRPARLSVVPVISWGLAASPPPTVDDAVGIACGQGHFLALLRNGTVGGWGGNAVGQAQAPANLTNAVAVAAGFRHSLALRGNGTVVAWGANDYGQTNVPPGLSDAVGIAAGDYHSLALRRDGTVVCWGDNRSGQLDVPPIAGSVVAIEGGGQHSVALLADGRVIGWGRNYEGQLLAPFDLTDAIAITAGLDFTVALRADGTAIGWGYNNGELIPSPSSAGPLQFISSSFLSTIAIKADGTLTAWGEMFAPLPASSNFVAISGENLGLIGDGPPTLLTPLPHRSVFRGSPLILTASAVGAPPFAFQWQRNGTNIPAATSRTLVVSEGDTTAAGEYRLIVTNPLGTQTSDAFAVDVVDSHPVIVRQPEDAFIFPGGAVTLHAVADGSRPLLYKWKRDGVEIPDATNTWLTIHSVSATEAGSYSLEVRNANGEATSDEAAVALIQVAGWGSGGGLLELPSSLTNVVALDLSGNHFLALNADGTVTAWGQNNYGQVNVPPGLTNAIAIAAGANHSLALRSDGSITAWGVNESGQTAVPAEATNVVGIAAGENHNLALRADGTVLGWGDNYKGKATPPPGLTNVVAVAVGTFHSVALKADGTVVGWGNNNFGEASADPRATNVVAIAAASYLTAALRSDGTVVAWGWNTSGRTNVSAGLSNVVAIAAGSQNVVALRDDGSVVMWGSQNATNIPSGLPYASAISSEGFVTLALVRPATAAADLHLMNSRIDGRSLTVSVPTFRGRVYQLQSSDAIPAARWTGSRLVVGNGDVLDISDTAIGSPKKFYRLMRW